ncbi:MAG: PAS domain-containing protein, partial [Pseudomonadota bacterium]|nr:PAS domain-containing protein [Pseudomonadota bacterium]
MNMQPKGNFEVDEDLELPLPVVSTDEEEAYGIEELFFSRTDERGIIQSYNDTFERIAGFAPGELMGAPHKLVRHGDVPKAVFWLLWNGLKAGVPVGAYVKNRTKSGKYYWVYAVASPISGGFLSVRMKPSSQLFAQVQELYQAALRDEQELGLSAEDSAHRLLKQLQGLGFPTYAMLQSH